MKRIGMVLAIAVLAGSLLSGCVIEPWGGRYDEHAYYGERGYYGERNYYGERSNYPVYPGSNYHRDR
jgi:hypothetical protein